MEKSLPEIRSLPILVLDDNHRWRRIVKSILESDLGVSPFVASSGPEALDIVKAHPICVAIVDLNMPEMNGVQFMERLRAHSSNTKVIMMSADLGFGLSQELMRRGAFAAVSKVEIASKLVSLL